MLGLKRSPVYAKTTTLMKLLVASVVFNFHSLLFPLMLKRDRDFMRTLFLYPLILHSIQTTYKYTGSVSF